MVFAASLRDVVAYLIPGGALLLAAIFVWPQESQRLIDVLPERLASEAFVGFTALAAAYALGQIMMTPSLRIWNHLLSARNLPPVLKRSSVAPSERIAGATGIKRPAHIG